MRIYLIFVVAFITDVHSCFRTRTETTTVKPTTTETPARREVVENIQVTKVQANTAQAPTAQKVNVATAELKKLAEELLKLDVNNVGSLLQLNLQGITTSSSRNDAAPSPLFSSFPQKALDGPTTKVYSSLLDNYIESVTRQDVSTKAEKAEEMDFLNAVMATTVMRRAEQFLQNKKIIRGSLRPYLEEIWFTPYSRSKGKVGSSGFEHVFLGELKNGQVSGLHNWIFFQKEEKERDVDYKGYIKVLDLGNKGHIIKLRFDWMNKRKAVGSMFVGTSPELEMAIYTVCFYTRQNKGCNLKMNNKNFSIKVYGQNYKGKTVIGSAFPQIY